MIRRELFAKYDVPVPRYTSYPTVPQWTDTPTPDAWRASLAAAAVEPDASLSVYVHVPFCESLCTYCGCNTVITRDHGRERPYVDVLMHELDLYRAAVPALDAMPVRHIHLGGGTPTFLAADALGRLVDGITSRLSARADSFEGSVEADPRVTNIAHLETLAARGFARLSLGIQDFDATVQNLVNRRQSVELVTQLTDDARRIGYESINFDLIYGLPAQTPASMATLRRPRDRFAAGSSRRLQLRARAVD